MAYFNPRDYFPTLQEWIRYGCTLRGMTTAS